MQFRAPLRHLEAPFAHTVETFLVFAKAVLVMFLVGYAATDPILPFIILPFVHMLTDPCSCTSQLYFVI